MTTYTRTYPAFEHDDKQLVKEYFADRDAAKATTKHRMVIKSGFEGYTNALNPIRYWRHGGETVYTVHNLDFSLTVTTEKPN